MSVAPRIEYCVPGRFVFGASNVSLVDRPNTSAPKLWSDARAAVAASALLRRYRIARLADFPACNSLNVRRASVPGDGETIAVLQDVEHGCFLKMAAPLRGAGFGLQ